ncbi:hypothetical protein [Steroidobacter sp.]|nr:hypothetical protein [Steroidobacter sp.]MBL8269952.1 hypothetical protein [Steroidobacter sp.]
MSLDDAYLKNFIYPLILMAQAADATFTLRTNGCLGQYPMIVGADCPPR